MADRKDQTADNAEKVAISALSFLAADPENLSRFLAFSGIGPDTLREVANSPEFLAGVLDFLNSDESLLLACAESLGIGPERIVAAHRTLAGDPPAEFS
ncbi:MAG: DUF3572 domain-containing protein [Hyphomicrobiales bacterium]|nr:DUF3572 domain-containing protein [Hyphomicrobiales bacterium]